MRIYLAALLIFIGTSGSARTYEHSLEHPVDFRTERNVDLTGDGVPDVITLEVKAETFASPFTWGISISSKGRIVHSIERSDKMIDHLFYDTDFVGECNDYYSCKEKWYFRELIYNIIVPESSYDLDGILNKKYPNGLFAVAPKYLNENYGIHGEEANEIIKKVAERLQHRISVVISIPITPVKGDSPLVFVPEIGKFMPIYEE